MTAYTVYDVSGRILRSGDCPAKLLAKQVGKDSSGELRTDLFVMEGKTDDAKQKIFAGKAVAKSSAEIAADQPPTIPVEDRPADISNKDLAAILARIKDLEGRL